MEEAATWLVHGGALAFELATDSYFLLSRTFVTFSSTLLSFMKAHVVSLAWGLVVGAAVIDSGRTFDTRLFASEFKFLGNNDRALCISRCKRNRTTPHIN